ncbi:MAG: LytR/AlgR family response regulator transcription factor [Saprospiraceae bacterium]
MKTPKIFKEIADISRILFVEAAENYSIFHLKSGSTIVSGYTLKYHLQYLDMRQFLRVNRSILVSRDYLEKVESANATSFAVLRNGRSIPIPRRRLKYFQEKYQSMKMV